MLFHITDPPRKSHTVHFMFYSRVLVGLFKGELRVFYWSVRLSG